MTSAENNHHATEGAADLPQSPPGAPEGHDGGEPLVTARGPEPDPEPAEQAPSAGETPASDGLPETLSGAELEALVARAAKADEYLTLAQRKQAEFENFRKRSARETAAARERGAMKLAGDLLPAVDNLERALQHAPQDGDEHGFVSGVRHVHADLLGALARAGIERYSPEGEPFDPTLHEAVAQQPTEGAEPGTVVEVFQSGYRAGDTVVRPARVLVAG